MSKSLRRVSPVDLVKPFFGVLYHDKNVLSSVKNRITNELNPIDFISISFPFDLTNYYSKEMGIGLIRTFIACKNFIEPQEIIRYKHFAFDLENELAKDNQRQINLDPGYLSYHQVVLTSGKCLPHKIYMGEGVYAEVEMIYKDHRYNSQPWSYADYSQHIDIFHQIRELYALQYKTLKYKPIPTSLTKKLMI